MARVSDILKMYQPQGVANGTSGLKPIQNRKWPPVQTNDSKAETSPKPNQHFTPPKPANKPTNLAPNKPTALRTNKPVNFSSNKAPPVSPKPISSALHPGGKDSPVKSKFDDLPPWKRELMKAREEANKQNEHSSNTVTESKKSFSTNTSTHSSAFNNLQHRQNDIPPKPDSPKSPALPTQQKPWSKRPPSSISSISSTESTQSSESGLRAPLPPPTPNKPKSPLKKQDSFPKPSFLHNNNNIPPPVSSLSPKTTAATVPVTVASTSMKPRRKELPSHVYEKVAPAKPYRPYGVNINAYSKKPPALPDRSVPDVKVSPATRPPATRPPMQLPSPSLPPLPVPPLSVQMPPPSPIQPDEDFYDLPPEDAANLPPPSPSHTNDTWDESDGEDRETSTSGGVPGGYTATDGELYESLEEYMMFKAKREIKIPQEIAPPKINKKDKKSTKETKDVDKKEKKTREKFKLPREGPIQPQFHGTVTAAGKGGGKNLAVAMNEQVEIIRMNGNPKGKWLIRNASGNYGYVDSDSVRVVTDDIRAIMSSDPAPIPTLDEEEEGGAIYDETSDVQLDAGNEEDDVYEEF